MATEHAQRSRWRDELLPNIVDRLSRETPEALYAEYPISPLSYDAGYRKITYRDLANAVNGAAWWLSQTLGPSKQHEVLTYVGPNDLRYIVLVLAAVKAGYVLFLNSPRNSVAAHVKLFERLKCTKLLSPEPKPAPVSTILEAHSMQHVAVPSVENLLDKQYPHYVYDKTFKEARSEPFMVIHTSGSTGFPKPLIYTNETAARNMSMLAQDPPARIRSMDRLVQGKRVLNCFPPFHGACLVSHLFAAIPFGTVMIAPLSGAISTAQGVVEALHQTTANAAFLVPSIILDLAQDGALLDYCSQNLERCLYAGGDLPQAVGDKVAAKLPLVCQYGASEVGLTPQLLPEEMGPLDWKYVYFHPCLGTEFREVADGNYELYVKHDPKKENEQPTFTILPDLKEYGTRDLFSPHPTLPNLWSWRARADDIIVFLNGEKTNPISMEQHIVAENAEVLTAIVVGAQRFQAALLLEPAPNAPPQNSAEEAAFIERVWPSIEAANKTAPAHARIEKAMILPMSSSKPVIRAGKGTIQRAATLQQYSAELDRLYQNADMNIGTADEIARPVDIQGIEAISGTVKTIMVRASGKTDINSHDNFFEFGMDSLQALNITRELRQSFRMPEIAIATVYSNPSIAKLSEAVQTLQKGKQDSKDISEKARAQSIASMLGEFKDKVCTIAPSTTSQEERPEKSIIVLTGSTGNIGTYLLNSLLENPAVEHVYCLNRRNDSRDVQKRRNEIAGFPLRENDSRVSFHTADLTQSNLGLATEVYDTIRERATLIIHNAWPVNFNLSLETFRPQLVGLLNFFALSASSSYRPRLFFISTISSVLGLHTPARLTPEEVVTDTNAPFGNGYAESKFIAELLCDEAARSLRIPVSIARVGQIAGPVRRRGIWNPAEWVPSLFISSIHIGALPDSLGASLNKVDWIPVDLLAETIVELSVDQDSLDRPAASGAEVFHIQNPNFTTWPALLPGVKSTIESLTSKPIDIIPAKSWLAKVRQDFELQSSGMSNGASEDLETLLRLNPAVKLLNFFSASMADVEGTNILSLEKTMAKSASSGAMDGVRVDWIHKWVSEWLLV
jgi:thioester reductase-like protein/acyl-coenzyme A synthetase/AMP-(fatty) acid ligase/aryl carrier-like protein